MPALGLSCNVRKGRIFVRGVLLCEGQATDLFQYAAAPAEDLAQQLRSLSNLLATQLQGLDVVTVVVRSADYHQSTRLKDHVALRFRGEGVLLSTARAYVGQVECLNGRAIGDLCHTSKKEVDARAIALLSKESKEATAAAIAAEQLRLNSIHG